MAHELRRVLRAFASQPWFIDPRKAEQIVAVLEMRALSGPRVEPYRKDAAIPRQTLTTPTGSIAVLGLYGTILPRAQAMQDISQSAALMTEFQQAFRQVASDSSIKAIVLDIDSPGGQVDMVPETAAMIRNASRADRPIVAVANTLAASAAYWIASAADELVVTPSGEVGSIGVYVLHEDVSQFLESVGVTMTFISEGPRKVEASPFEPLSDEAKAALQANVRYFYDMFTADVAKGRKVSQAIVRADPEKTDKHFGGGRVYPAKTAVALGMADRVATLDETVTRLSRASAGSTGRARSSLITL